MSSFNTHPHPTLPQLIKATGVALVAAGAILITTVLPAVVRSRSTEPAI